MKSKHIILSRLLPKTGQVTSFYTGDDGTHQAGWWKGRKIADNIPRWIFIERFGQKVAIDRATGLWWPRDGIDAGWCNGLCETWELALTYAGMSDFFGETDWRIPNVKELISILDYEQDEYYLPSDVFFNVSGKEWVWTSTTNMYQTFYAYAVSMAAGYCWPFQSKTDDGTYLILVRGGI